MKSDYPFVFGSRPYSKDLDYIALWFIKGADYIEDTEAQLAFVATNSVTQGEHVGLMFPMIFSKGIEISYAYTSFKWENNAKRNAGVSVVVIGLRSAMPTPKYIYTEGLQIEAGNINGYLADAPSLFIYRRTKPLASLPKMTLGSMPKDGGNLVLTGDERASAVAKDPRSDAFLKKYVGSEEYIKDLTRYCVWVTDGDRDEAEQVGPIAERLAAVAAWRASRTEVGVKAYANHPNRFKQVAYKPTDSIIVPRHSSERRPYIPMGYLSDDFVISDAALAVYDAEPWTFALLTSATHMVWTRAVGGQLETRLRYSNTIVYNNFPVPPLKESTKDALTEAALRVLDVREYHCELTLAELYDPDRMPKDLRAAHAEIDALVDSLYSKKPYETDEQRLSDLFAMYEAITAAEASKGTKK